MWKGNELEIISKLVKLHERFMNGQNQTYLDFLELLFTNICLLQGLS